MGLLMRLQDLEVTDLGKTEAEMVTLEDEEVAMVLMALSGTENIEVGWADREVRWSPNDSGQAAWRDRTSASCARGRGLPRRQGRRRAAHEVAKQRATAGRGIRLDRGANCTSTRTGRGAGSCPRCRPFCR